MFLQLIYKKKKKKTEKEKEKEKSHFLADFSKTDRLRSNMNTPGHMIWLIDYKNEKKKKEKKKRDWSLVVSLKKSF